MNKYIKIQFRHTVGLINLWRVCKSATVCDYLPHSHDNRSLLVRDITGSLRVRPGLCARRRCCRTRMKAFKWGNISPLLSKEGLGVVSHPLLSKAMIFISLLFNHP